ncbi:MAG: tetratricopeptide repeat protein [Candidatus Margulisiibacteriota bacterium]
MKGFALAIILSLMLALPSQAGEAKKLDTSKHSGLLVIIKNSLKQNAKIPSTGFEEAWQLSLNARSFYELDVNRFYGEFSRTIAVMLAGDKEGFALYLFAATPDYKSAKYLAGSSGSVAINIAKFDISTKGDQIAIWSQRPYSADEQTTVLKWDGKKLSIIGEKGSDPSLKYFEKMKKLVADGKLEEAMKSKEEVFYPSAYSEYYEVPSLIIKGTHKYALTQYRQGKTKAAIEVLKWGIDEYLTLQLNATLSIKNINNLEELLVPATDIREKYRIPKEEFAAILNDYAFFLSQNGKNKDAEKYLEVVVEFDPNRTVALLNIGDVCWALGKKDAAIDYYNRYLEYMGTNNPKIPKRVLDRVK